jgi:EmrB/QacA subfamily drug resistance transporter
MDPEKRTYLWLVLSICFAAFMATLDSYIVTISLPVIARSFEVGPGAVSWVVLSYVLFLTAAMLVVGKLADRIGLKRIFLIGYWTFLAGSALCGISVRLDLLTAARALQGVGGAMLTVPAYALIPRHVPEGIRGWAFGLLATAAALGLAVGAPAGGLITGYLSWNWIFLINLPIGIPAILLAWKVLPDDAAQGEGEAAGRFDLPGALLSFTGVLLLILTLNRGRELGWGSHPVIAGFAGSALLAALFVVRESRVENPLIDPALFASRNFTRAAVGAGLAFLVLAGSNFLLPFYLQRLKGMPPQDAGFVLLLYSVAYLAVSPLAGRAADRIAPARLCFLGTLSAAAACGFFSLSLSCGGLAPVALFLVWLGASYGLFFSPNTTLVMNAAPPDGQGVASGVFSVISRLSIVLGVSLFETLFSQFAPEAGSGAAAGTVSPSALQAGFRAAYILGAGLCLAASLFSASLMIGRSGSIGTAACRNESSRKGHHDEP